MVHTMADRNRHLIRRDEALSRAFRLGVVRLIATGLETTAAQQLGDEPRCTGPDDPACSTYRAHYHRAAAEEAAALRSAPLANDANERYDATCPKPIRGDRCCRAAGHDGDCEPTPF